MTRSTEPLDGDVRGRTVVWSAGSVSDGRSRRVGHPLARRLGLVLLAAAAVFSLSYAVHAWVVISPPSAGPAVPLWLPEQLPAEVGDDAGRPRPTVLPTAVHSPVEAKPDTPSNRSTAGRGQTRTTDDHGVTTGHRSGSSPSSHSSKSSAGSGLSAHSGHSSGGSSSSGSGGSSGSGRGGSDDQATDNHGSSSGSGHGSNSGSEHSGSGHGGADDGGSHGSGGSGGSGGSKHGGDDS